MKAKIIEFVRLDGEERQSAEKIVDEIVEIIQKNSLNMRQIHAIFDVMLKAEMQEMKLTF